MIKYSFIIPVKEINDYVREAIPVILAIAREDYEIIIYPDAGGETTEAWPKTRQIPSEPSPSAKRNLSLRDARGEVLVFIDDDAYPETNFLDLLEKALSDKRVLAVGGPALTPRSDSFWQKVSGAVFLSKLSGGCPERYRSMKRKSIKIDDWPSVNFSIRKKTFEELGGFGCKYWPGEDTKLCLDLVKKYPGSIIYERNLIVYHHRRAGLAKHLGQVAGYGLHRGFFAHRYPDTSFKLIYFMPSFLVLFIIFGAAASAYHPLFLKLYLFGWIIYFCALLKAFYDISRHEKNILIMLNAVYVIFLTHIVYGINFIKGFVFTKNLVSKLR